MTYKRYHIVNESAADVFNLADKLHEYTTAEVMSMFGDPFDWKENADVREKFVRKFGWSIPSKDAVDIIREYNSDNYLLDLMAGTGYWTHIMKIAGGINVRAYDISPGQGRMSSKETYGFQGTINNIHVKEMDALKVIQGANRWMDKTDNQANIFMSWPPNAQDIGYRIIRNMHSATLLFYVGERSGGCTGCIRMHKYLEQKFIELATVSIPTFEGINDFLGVYLKR